MKTIAVLFAMFIGSLVQSQNAESGKINVSVPNVNGTQGAVHFALHTADTFMKKAAVASAKSAIIDGKATVTFEGIENGTYAIVVLHDKNENGKMDMDPSGMPAEDYGTSGNSMSFGPPNWEESKFNFDSASKDIEIRF